MACTPRNCNVDHALALLRQAVTESGWTYEALEAETRKDRAYINRVLNGEKPCRLDFLAILPVDVRKRYAELVAKQYHVDVIDRASVEVAASTLLAWLVSALKPSMAKASLESPSIKTGAA